MGIARQLSMPVRSAAQLLTRLNSSDLVSRSSWACNAPSMLMPLDIRPSLVQELQPVLDEGAGVAQVLKHMHSSRPVELTAPAHLYQQPLVMMKPHAGISIVYKHNVHSDQYNAPAAQRHTLMLDSELPAFQTVHWARAVHVASAWRPIPFFMFDNSHDWVPSSHPRFFYLLC